MKLVFVWEEGPDFIVINKDNMKIQYMESTLTAIQTIQIDVFRTDDQNKAKISTKISY